MGSRCGIIVARVFVQKQILVMSASIITRA